MSPIRMVSGLSTALILFFWNWYIISRGHSRNRPKGGRNSPQRYTSTHLRTASVCFYSQRVQNPLEKTLPAVFGTKLRLFHSVRLVWRHNKITNFLSKNSFVKVKGWSRDHRDLWLEWSLIGTYFYSFILYKFHSQSFTSAIMPFNMPLLLAQVSTEVLLFKLSTLSCVCMCMY